MQTNVYNPTWRNKVLQIHTQKTLFFKIYEIFSQTDFCYTQLYKTAEKLEQHVLFMQH